MANSDNLDPAPTQPYNVTSVAVTPATNAVALSGTVQLTATAKDKNGVTVAGVNFMWESRNPSVASVSASGLVTAYAGRQPIKQHKQDSTDQLVGGAVTVYATAKRGDGSLTQIAGFAIVNVASN